MISKLAFVLGLLLMLSGCAGLGFGLGSQPQPQLTPAQQVFSLKGQYEAMLIPIEYYEAQPRCTEVIVVVCSDPALVEKIRASIRSVRPILEIAETNVRANPNMPPSAAISAAIREGLAQLNMYVLEMGTGGTS